MFQLIKLRDVARQLKSLHGYDVYIAMRIVSDSFAQYPKEAARYPLLNKNQEIMLASGADLVA